MSYLDSVQMPATKVQLNYNETTDITTTLGTAITINTWTDIGTNHTFTVDDPNSVIEIYVGGAIQLGATAANMSSRLVVDSAGANLTYPLGGGAPQTGSYPNPLAGAQVVVITGLSAGSHTVKTQVFCDTTSGNKLYLACASAPNTYSYYIRVLERKVMPSIFSGPQPTTKVQLDYEPGSDLLTGGAITSWTDVFANQTFTVDDPNSVVEISVSGHIYCTANTAGQYATRIVIDSAGTTVTKPLSASWAKGNSQADFTNALSGADTVSVTGLAAGSHTVKVQVIGSPASSIGYCRPGTNGTYEFINLRVLERKQTAAMVSNTIVKLAEVIVGAGGQANIAFSNIPQTYRHLQVAFQGRGDTAASLEVLSIQFNSDTGLNYDSIQAQFNLSPPNYSNAYENLASASIRLGYLVCANAPANVADLCIVDIPNYAGTTFQKTCKARGTLKLATTTTNVFDITASGWWRSTAAITSILLFPASGNFVAGSVCSLYGIV